MLVFIELHFTSPLHLGKGKPDYSQSENTLHSDTLYAATLSAAYRYLSNEAAQLLENSMAFSDTFPFATDKQQQKVYFLPKPSAPVQRTNDTQKQNSKERKTIKKIAYYDTHYFGHFLKNGYLPQPEDSKEHIYGNLLTKAALPKPFLLYETELTHRAQISRSQDDAMPFEVEKIYFKKGNGLYFWLYAENEAALQQIITIWQNIAQEGIGGYKSIGMGQFNVQVVPNPDISWLPPLPEKPVFSCNLGLLSPEKEKPLFLQQPEKVGYQLITRYGYTAQHPPVRKAATTMLLPGALLDYAEKTPFFLMGKRHNVAPQGSPNPIYRNGKTICLTLGNVTA